MNTPKPIIDDAVWKNSINIKLIMRLYLLLVMGFLVGTVSIFISMSNHSYCILKLKSENDDLHLRIVQLEAASNGIKETGQTYD